VNHLMALPGQVLPHPFQVAFTTATLGMGGFTPAQQKDLHRVIQLSSVVGVREITVSLPGMPEGAVKRRGGQPQACTSSRCLLSGSRFFNHALNGAALSPWISTEQVMASVTTTKIRWSPVSFS